MGPGLPDLSPTLGGLEPGPYLVDRFVRPFSSTCPGIGLVRTLDPALSTTSSDYWMVGDARARHWWSFGCPYCP
jgi:hypothetical protein